MKNIEESFFQRMKNITEIWIKFQMRLNFEQANAVSAFIRRKKFYGILRSTIQMFFQVH